MTHSESYLTEAVRVLKELDAGAIEELADELFALRERGGRLFVLGVGGGAAHASHAVNDFRKLCGIEAYAPTDNVAELTARVNDEGWESTFSGWLEVSHLGPSDMLFIFSVGGGNREAGVSANLVAALELARSVGARIGGIVGRDGGHTKKLAHAAVLVPVARPEAVTPHTEGTQAVVWHLLVSHPKLQIRPTKW